MAISINGVDGNIFTTRDVDASPNNFVFSTHLLTFSGNYTTGGDTLNLTTIAGLIPSGSLPIALTISDQGRAAVPSLSAAGGFYTVIQNAVPTLANYLLKIFKNTAGSIAEYSNGAYGTDVTTDVVFLQLQWRKLTN
jgi:hypothetical protein